MYVDKRMVRVNVAIAVCTLLFLSVVAVQAVIGDGSSVATADPVATPSVTAPVPRGSGSRVAGDVNGDGYADLVFVAPAVHADARQPAYLGVVHGTARGLDPAVRTVMDPGGTPLPLDRTPGGVPTADLDGDGYADILAGGHVIWGGPVGPRENVPSPKLGGVPGDFDGDGQEDLAVGDGVGIRVLYGPFTSEGTPRRTGAARPNPISAAGLGYEDSGFHLTAGDADGDGATDLVVTAYGDGEQTPSVLLHAGVGLAGFTARTEKLPTGSSVAFGDFDGDGTDDIATGDSGDRNNEPGADAESAHGIVTVSYGGGRPAKRIEPGATGSYATGDLDHDGRDELLISVPGGARILHGSADGLTTDGTTFRRAGAGEDVPASERPAQLAAVRDFDRDGRAEVVLNWSRDGLGPSRWWVIEGGGDEVAAFTDAEFTD